MRFLLFFRDRVLPYLFVFSVVALGGGGLIWLFLRTYFWHTSDIVFLVDDEVHSAKIDISARIFYKDFIFFDSIYPVHITFPFSREIDCEKKCIFADVPAGNAQVTLRTQANTQLNERVLILPDTQGTIDMRVPIRVTEFFPKNTLTNGGDISQAQIYSKSIFYENKIQGVWLYYDRGRQSLYDGISGQSFLLTNDTDIRSVARGLYEGEYYLVNAANEILLYDRYGRKKTEKVSSSTAGEWRIDWENRDGSVVTQLHIGDAKRVFPGRLFWLNIEDKYYLFDGNKVFDILNK